VSAAPAFTTFLFTDIEGSTRLWEREPERMRLALARHDAVCQAAVQAHQGRIVKGTGDGIHAVFDDPLPAVLAVPCSCSWTWTTTAQASRWRCACAAACTAARWNTATATSSAAWSTALRA
jgi:class 3 adenylate cyclase